MKLYWVAVDWGTTNFRAFLMKGNRLIDEVSNMEGILSVKKGMFEITLYQNIINWLKSHTNLPIIMAGMVGSQQGWREIPYLTLPATFDELSNAAQKLQVNWQSQIWLIPGVQSVSQYSLPDVMRGEETQLLGLPEDTDNYIILPGTHSKHCIMSNGTINTVTSFMTGELYSLLINYSMIGKELFEQIDSEKFFLIGVDSVQDNIPFTHLIFSARTKRLNNEIPNKFIGSYISGILIGTELKKINHDKKIFVISNKGLGDKYITAGKYLNFNIEHLSSDTCFLNGAYKLIKKLETKNEN